MSRATQIAKMKADVAAAGGTAAPVVAPAPMVAVAAPVPAPMAAPAPAPVAAAPAPVPEPAYEAPPSLLPAGLQEPLWEPAAPTPAPAAPTYDMSAVVAQANELAAIKRQHEAAMQEIAALRSAPPPVANNRRAAKDVLTADSWKSENVDHAVAVDLLDGLSPAIEAMIEERIRAATAPVEAQLKHDQERSAANRLAAFESKVIEKVPFVREMLADRRFNTFLSSLIPGVGEAFSETYNRHVTNQNADGIAWVAAQFSAYTRAGVAAAPAVAPASVALEPAPARGGSHVQTETRDDARAVDPKEFDELRKAVASHRITRAEFSTKFAALQQRALGVSNTAARH